MKYTDGMTGIDYIVAMSEGNPGAVSVLTQLLSVGEGFPDVIALDQRGLYGSNIWAMYKDQCGQDIEAMRSVLRG